MLKFSKGKYMYAFFIWDCDLCIHVCVCTLQLTPAKTWFTNKILPDFVPFVLGCSVHDYGKVKAKYALK